MGFNLRGLKSGFRIGFGTERENLVSCPRNMLSTIEHLEVVSKYLEEELRLGRIARVCALADARKNFNIHCSPIGVIPKKNRPNKWRLIVDLSSPESHSMNDGVCKILSSLSYTSIDDVVAVIRKAGKGEVLAKMDVKQAYRNIPVHPNDRGLLGMHWEGHVYVDKTLPFGLRSAPLLFTAVADALQWVMQQRGVRWLFHYIDDFITIGAPLTSECKDNVDVMKAV